MKGFRFYFKAVPKDIIIQLINLGIFSPLEITMVNFMDHLDEFKGPSPELEDKRNIVAHNYSPDLLPLIAVMHDKMANGLWLCFDKVEVIR